MYCLPSFPKGLRQVLSQIFGGGEAGEGGAAGGDGGDGGRKQSSQPALVTLLSVRHSIGVPSGTTPSGETVPQ